MPSNFHCFSPSVVQLFGDNWSALYGQLEIPWIASCLVCSLGNCLGSFLGCLGGFRSETEHVELDDHTVMHQWINRGRSLPRVFEDRGPLRESQVAR